jgi:hypothetical protein
MNEKIQVGCGLNSLATENTRGWVSSGILFGILLTLGEQCLLVVEAVLSEPVLGINTRCEYN